MIYGLIPFTRMEPGRGPDLPPGANFLWLCEPGRDAEFALYEYEPVDTQPLPETIQPVSNELSRLIDSAKSYPPAIAFACRDLERSDCSDRAQFLATYEERLRFHFDRRRDSGCFLAEAIVGTIGYKRAGEKYWIVRYVPERIGEEIVWLADDYFVYQDSIDHFKVDPVSLARVLWRKRNPE